MMRDACRAVHRALELRLRLMILFKEAGAGAGSRVEQYPRRAHERLRARGIKPEKPRKAQIRERVPPVAAALRRRARGIQLDKSTDRDFVSMNRCGIDVASGDFRVRRQELPRSIEVA